jgi:hypothetical protein
MPHGTICFHPDDEEFDGAADNLRYRPEDEAGRGTAGWCFRPDDDHGKVCFHPDEDAFYGALTEADARELRHLEPVGGRADR